MLQERKNNKGNQGKKAGEGLSRNKETATRMTSQKLKDCATEKMIDPDTHEQFGTVFRVFYADVSFGEYSSVYNSLQKKYWIASG